MAKAGNIFVADNHKRFIPDTSVSSKPEFISPLASGLNRRAFLRQTSASILIAGIAACKPNVPSSSNTENKAPNTTIASDKFVFDDHQKKSLVAVQMQLFPSDGDGPSATDINGLAYLEWALTDPGNIDDGDGEFIVKGIGWLDGLSEQTQGDKFINLSSKQQDKVLKQIGESSTGENWISLLLYYLIEALLLDPFYGGNPDGIGWKWLKIQPGFPTPDKNANYLTFS
jgi:gluconate 2-dehydrogenase gamma chain